VPERRRHAGRVLGALLPAVLLGGCGDSTKGSLPEHIQTVGVPIFKNRTLEPGVESAITSAVVNAVSDTIARGQGAVQAATEVGRKVVNPAVDRF
jgi:hypothetical protein